ncbi:MAG: hypothetical protein M1839_009275 [Geoglossum umbratile]|nr:MAG: hypothetical protein M1839_009275 [Geoglossum umbratile]
MTATAIGRAVLANLIENRRSYLVAILDQWRQILAAPAEVNEVGRQVEALYISLEQLLEQVDAEDSIISVEASEEAQQMEKFLEGCTANMTLLLDIMEKYSTGLAGGRRTWKESFQRIQKNIFWTLERGNVDDLIQKIKDDIQIVTNMSTAIQSKAMVRLQSTLGRVAEDTALIRERVDRLDAGMELIYNLLRGIAQGSRDSIYNMFGSSGSNDDDSNDDGPPPYDGRHALGKQDFISNDRFRCTAAQQWQLVPQNEPSSQRVTTAEFLWRMAKVAADVHPWDNKIRASNRYPNGTCDKELYNVVCHLMSISETRTKWSTISLASWLTAGAWHLSLARFKMSLTTGKSRGSPMEIYASFVKSYWIILTIDQHPQKPLLQDAGQTNQDLEQYENLIAALHNEIRNAEQILQREPLQAIVSELRKNMGKIWEREEDCTAVASDHVIGFYASRILESAAPSQSYIKPTSNELLGQWESLCPHTCICLPKDHEHVPEKPSIFACMCGQSKHLQSLHQFYDLSIDILIVTVHSCAENMNDTTLEIHNVQCDKDQIETVTLAVECPTQAARDNLRKELGAVTKRLSILQSPRLTWTISSFKGPKTLRLIRSPFDNGKIGAPFVQAFSNPRQQHWREVEVPKEVERVVEEEVLVEKPGTVWSGFWSFFGYEPGKERVKREKRISELVTETKMVPDDELNAYFTPKPKPPDCTEALAITPLTVSLYTHWAVPEPMSTLHIVNPTSCFELWLELGMHLGVKSFQQAAYVSRIADSRTQFHRVSNTLASVNMLLPPKANALTMVHSTPMATTLDFSDPLVLENFQRSIFIARAHSQLGYIEQIPRSGECRKKSPGQEVLWEGQVQACANEQVKSAQSAGGRRILILMGKHNQGNSSHATGGMVWETSNMTDSFMFKIDQHGPGKSSTIPSRSTESYFRLRITKVPTTSADVSTGEPGTQLVIRNAHMRERVPAIDSGFYKPPLEELAIQFITAKDAKTVRGLCEGRKIRLQCFLRWLKFEPAKKLGVYISSKSQSASTMENVFVEIVDCNSERTMHLWLSKRSIWPTESKFDIDEQECMMYTHSETVRYKRESKVVLLSKAKITLQDDTFTKDTTGKLQWKGNFELFFNNEEDSIRIYDALTRGVIEEDVEEDVETIPLRIGK